ncbi:hypothetical protein GCM10011349_19870 [Novosphingobium indicum]|uniref:Uncharacterized protein n=1 Tax=Novosphingobium indicum TaxID=462949 RepID=A0ABQ2JML9_9SPHN|nr:hypothetical protein GCM10011349_19870 [Novosphingobium indicum]
MIGRRPSSEAFINSPHSDGAGYSQNWPLSTESQLTLGSLVRLEAVSGPFRRRFGSAFVLAYHKRHFEQEMHVLKAVGGLQFAQAASA